MLAKVSRLSERAVWQGLDDAVNLGWLKRQQMKMEAEGKGWRRNLYFMAIPADGLAPRATASEHGHAPDATATGTDGLAMVSHVTTDGLARTPPLVTHQVRTNQVLLKNHIRTIKELRGRGPNAVPLVGKGQTLLDKKVKTPKGKDNNHGKVKSGLQENGTFEEIERNREIAAALRDGNLEKAAALRRRKP